MMFAAISFETVSRGIGDSPFLSASLMMAATGGLTLLMLRAVSLQSWRLRSLLVAAVLLQGVMVVRHPVHLGWIERDEALFSSATTSAVALDEWSVSSLPPVTVSASDASVESTPLLIDSSDPSIESFRIPWGRIAATVWSIAVLLTLLVGGWRYARLLRLVGRLPAAPTGWQDQCDSVVADTVGTRRRVRMLVSESAGPLLVRRPGGYVLVVPRHYWDSLSVLQRHTVLLHETAHIIRRDVWRQLAARLIATLHWFNPVGWWAVRQYEIAAECACDHRVARQGKRAAAEFASALIELTQWQQNGEDADPSTRGLFDRHRFGRGRRAAGVGFQSMAAPPLRYRISRLIRTDSTGDSSMKRLAFGLGAIAMIIVSLVQLRLTSAQERTDRERPDRGAPDVQVISEDRQRDLLAIADSLDSDDVLSSRFAALLDSSGGKIAIAGLLEQLADRSHDRARSEAIPRFFDQHFTRRDDGKWIARPGTDAAIDQWKVQSVRVADNVADLAEVMHDYAARIDTTREAGGLFKRMLLDPQAPVAVLIHEMDGGGDMIDRFIAETLGRVLVDQGDGTFAIVQSRRDEMAELIEGFERAAKISTRMKQELPRLAAEYTAVDERHERLIAALRNPTTAVVVASMLADDIDEPSRAVEHLRNHFEEVSIDTAKGLVIRDDEAWEQLDEIQEQVERAGSATARVKQRLSEIAKTLSADDPLTARLKQQMTRQPAVVRIAAELPYAEADPAAELKEMLAEVLRDSGDKLTFDREREEEVAEKSRELLQICRAIRRHVADVEQMIGELSDASWLSGLGDAGRYTLLNEIQRSAERHRPDPIALLKDELFAEDDSGRLRVRPDKDELVRDLIERADRVRAQESLDDF